jgi:hypothetical protein
MIHRCEDEILELHRFFERWFRGEIEDSPETFARLSEVLSERFRMITPGGERVERRQLLEGVRQRHGSHGGPGRSYRIRIDNVEGRYRDAAVALMTYEEWQEVDGQTRGRLSSALFREREDTPCGVEWLHLHETWLPGGSP